MCHMESMTSQKTPIRTKFKFKFLGIKVLCEGNIVWLVIYVNGSRKGDRRDDGMLFISYQNIETNLQTISSKTPIIS